jgi:hypothetical protein
MNVRRAGAALLLTLLSGCASGGTTWVFEKSGATEAQIKHDRDECFAQSIDTDTNGVAVGFQISREAYKACMEGRGYRVRVAMVPTVPAVER